MYDTHCHPYLAKEKSRDSILENFFNSGGIHLNTIAVDTQSSQTCIELANNHPWVHATIGIHPTYTLDAWELKVALQELRNLYQQNKEHIVAIGESGLDYYWLTSLSQEHNISKEEIIDTQKRFFIWQIHLARELWLPLVIHNRESGEDIFKILKQESFKNFVFHCFSEDLDFANRLIDFAPECKLGFGWVTTFKSADSIMEAATSIPLENIMIETDSPYLTPVPYRGKEENEPLFVKHILDHIIDLREEPAQEIERIILENSIYFFGIN